MFVKGPCVLEKIVEKVVVMPQIMKVLKYVHESVDNEDLAVELSHDVLVYIQK